MDHAAALVFDLSMRIQSHVFPVRIIVDIVVGLADELGVDLWGETGFGLDVYAGHGLVEQSQFRV